MTYSPPPMIDSMLCRHSAAECCTSSALGHVVSGIRERVTAATPGKWRDGIVAHAPSTPGRGGSWIGIHLFETPGITWLWNHADLSTAASLGEPVSLHELYDTLAIGPMRVSVLRAPSY